MSHISHLLSFNFMLVTSWCLTLWCSLQTSPYSFSLFALQKERLNAIYKRQWPQLLRLPAGPVAGLPDASLLTFLKQCKKKEYRILICLLFISNLWWWAPTVWSLDSPSGETQFLRHKSTVFSPLPAWGLKLSVAEVQPQLIQGVRSGDSVGEDQDTIASIRY